MCKLMKREAKEQFSTQKSPLLRRFGRSFQLFPQSFPQKFSPLCKYILFNYFRVKHKFVLKFNKIIQIFFCILFSFYPTLIV